jgi:hypothetical protein
MEILNGDINNSAFISGKMLDRHSSPYSTECNDAEAEVFNKRYKKRDTKNTRVLLK